MSSKYITIKTQIFKKETIMSIKKIPGRSFWRKHTDICYLEVYCYGSNYIGTKFGYDIDLVKHQTIVKYTLTYPNGTSCDRVLDFFGNDF